MIKEICATFMSLAIIMTVNFTIILLKLDSIKDKINKIKKKMEEEE